MLSIALCGLRSRWVTFTGSFLALSLGVALLAVMGLALASTLDAPPRGPERFAGAPVVVRGRDTLRVETPNGVRTQRLARPHAVLERTVAVLRHLGEVTLDRSFAVRAEGGPDGLVGHPWPTAAFARYELSAGRAPRAAGEVAVTGDWTAVGRRVRTDSGTVRVVGTLRGPDFEDAVFFTDHRAARLAPISRQLVVDADASTVRRVVGGRAEVLTGGARRLADADPDREAEELTALNALFGTAGGVSGFVSVFVVASTSAFVVARRRREFGLLRTAGATPGQIRRTVLTEALVVGVLASAAGCALGGWAAPHLAARVVDEGLAPAWFTIRDHVWPYQVAFWTGLFVASAGAAAASWRAGRTRPAEALREASADSGTLTRGRLLCGAALLAVAAVTLALTLLSEPGELLHRKSYVSRPMLLISAAALLSPALVRPLTRLITWLPARLPGAGGMLVRAGAGTHRTAAVAAPVLVTVALTGSLLGAGATLGAARSAELDRRTTADLVVTAAAGSDGFDAATVRRLRAVPGAEAAASATSTVHVLEDGVALVRSEAHAVDPRGLAATVRLPVTSGRIAALDDDSIVVNEEWAAHRVGQRVTVWLGDGTRRSLRIAAVLSTGTGDNGVYVTPANAGGAPVDRVDVKVTAAGDTDAVAAEVRRALRTPARVLTREEWIRAATPRTGSASRLGLFLVLGIALLYTGISLATTQVMATTGRRRELRTLRLAGATGGQVLRLVAAEAIAVVAVGAMLGILVAGLQLLGLWGALDLLGARSAVRMPWAETASTAGACAVLTVVPAVGAAGLALRHRKGPEGGRHVKAPVGITRPGL
ncbi:FtsX-like permease family protein [Streptomyces sp. NPDC005574]|uniref:FtsX-like permease family protein n=1 Tax=Streptomyces sp. NPDC005574 TaxID=3156891 RepID=UPI0033A64E62